MDLETFIAKYKPIKNQFGGNGCYDGCAFETYGEEVEYVREIARTDPHKIWTLEDCEGFEVICAGYHHVNRMMYFITENPWEDSNDEVELPQDPSPWTCPECDTEYEDDSLAMNDPRPNRTDNYICDECIKILEEKGSVDFAIVKFLQSMIGDLKNNEDFDLTNIQNIRLKLFELDFQELKEICKQQE